MTTTKRLGSSFIFKVLTAGDGGVGKTSLLERFVNNSFSEEMKITIGVQFFMKEVDMGDGKEYRLQMWDFGGEEQFKHVLPSYVKGAVGALLMFDLTRVGTLKNIDEWVDLLRNENPKLPIIFVGTKLDLEEYVCIDDSYALDYKDKFDFIDYIKVSSKTGQDVNETFQILTKNALDHSNEAK